MRVAAGAIARKIISDKIKNNVVITGALIQIDNKKINYNNWDQDFINKNDFHVFANIQHGWFINPPTFLFTLYDQVFSK